MKVETPIGEQTLNAGESVRCDENKIGPVQERKNCPKYSVMKMIRWSM